MPKKKDTRPKFSRLDGYGAVHHDRLCEHCGKLYALPSWDTMLGDEKHLFCSGDCLYSYLEKRYADSTGGDK